MSKEAEKRWECFNTLRVEMASLADSILDLEEECRADGFPRDRLVGLYDLADSVFGAANIKRLLDALSAKTNQETQPVVWGSPKTVGQLIGQLQTLEPAMETTALLRITALDKIRQVPISISFERLDGQWLAPYKGEGRKVLAFWAKADDRELTERGELLTAPPAVPDERAAFNAWNNEDNLPIAGVPAKNAAWLAWQARAMLAQPVSQGYKLPDNVREALTLALQAMEFMGDTLNNIDAVCTEDVEYVTPAFTAVRRLLAAVPEGNQDEIPKR